MARWAVFIDLEGFSSRYRKSEVEGLSALRELVGAAYRLFCHLPRDPGGFPPLGVHQIGDGFVVVSHSANEPINQPIAVAIGLLRYMLCKGLPASAGVSTGGFGDIVGCYPPELRDKLDDTNAIRDADKGIMTVWPVMGTALINAYRTSHARPKGPMLLVDATNCVAEPNMVLLGPPGSILAVDWISPQPKPLADAVEQVLEALSDPEPSALRDRLREQQVLRDELRQYLEEHSSKLRDDWKESAMQLVTGKRNN